MINFFKWKELYTTFSLEEQLKISRTLTEHNIPVKVKFIDSRNRMSKNVILGANPMIVNSAGLSPNYSSSYVIYTEKNFTTEQKIFYKNWGYKKVMKKQGKLSLMRQLPPLFVHTDKIYLYLADLCPCRHRFLRRHKSQIPLCILRAEDHSFGKDSGQLGRL